MSATPIITLSLAGGDVLMDRADFERLRGRSVYLGTNGYPYFSTEKTGPVTLHSFVMGGARKGQHIDHINGEKLDCRRANLRFVSHQINQANRKSLSRRNTSGIRGVTYRPEGSAERPWRAQITVNSRNLYLGIYETKEEAAAARKAAELEHYGETCP